MEYVLSYVTRGEVGVYLTLECGDTELGICP